jgi:hypothetical protein
MLFFRRHALNAVVKLARMSQWKFNFGATAEFYAGFATKGKGLFR